MLYSIFIFIIYLFICNSDAYRTKDFPASSQSGYAL
jgi:hypothetical protein